MVAGTVFLKLVQVSFVVVREKFIIFIKIKLDFIKNVIQDLQTTHSTSSDDTIAAYAHC